MRQPKSKGLDIGDASVDISDGIGGVIISILLWIFIGLFGAIIIWMIGLVFWIPIAIAIGLLYWVVYNCYSMIFRKSPECKGNLIDSF